MSENINIDANNLCITEEVFEKFQAESMYEEEELITLSDILPSNGTAAPSAPDDVNDLLADDNVKVSDIQIVNSDTETATANVQHSEITTGPGADLGYQEQVLLESSDLNVSENVEVHTESVEQKQPRRRGRQKKKPVQESSECITKEQTEQSRPKRTARKKTFLDDSVNDISIEEQMKLIHEDNPTKEQQVFEENKEAQIPIRRGGRRKKTVQEPNVNTSVEGKIEVTESEQVDLKINSQNGQDNVAPTKRRGRKNKTLQNSSIENSNLNSNENLGNSENKVDINDDLPISHMQNKTISNENNVDDCPNSESTELTKIRSRRSSNRAINYSEIDSEKPLSASPGKRRGRPKKQPQSLSKPHLSQFIENKNDSDISTSKVGDLSDITKVEEPSSTVDKLDEEISQEKKAGLNSEIDNDDEGDDICLSNLKRVLVSQDNVDASANSKEDVISSTNDIELDQSKNNVPANKRNSKAPVHPDFEYNLDNIANEDADKAKEITSAETKKSDGDAEDLLVEETGGRPKRRKTKQNFRYQEDSDEDPFANVELSDDEPKRGKRGTKYYSDDEYIPGRGKKRGKSYSTDSSQSSDMEEIAEGLEGVAKQKRKRFSKKMDSPKKKGALDVTTIPPASTNTDDIEFCLESSVIKNPQIDDSADNKSNTWGHTNEFESFIAQKIQGTDLKIKKVSSTKSTATIAPLDIPSIDPKAQKILEKSTQTLTTSKNAQGVQTSPPYDIPMKENVPLSKEQSEKACEFLNSIVKTTSELGVLMTQKSEDFMKKKIHTAHVTDTFKMDYCVRKSFLLFKLAKHNLMQMEEDLANQYEEFLKANNLHTHREQIKTVVSTSVQKGEDNDSDCEIVDVKPIASSTSKSAVTVKKNEKPKFNPKTVFLNKELSIKIAKKTPDDKKLNIKGRHSVWINDSVILKKVTPTQSFLAQDSRNKKPPDSSKIIEKIVCDFFREYDRLKAMSVCAPFISTEWINVKKNYACNYFVASPEIPTGSDHYVNSPDPETISEDKTICEAMHVSLANLISPKSLFTLCTLIIQKQSYSKRCSNAEKHRIQETTPQALFALCLHSLNKSNSSPVPSKAVHFTNAQALKTICLKKVIELFSGTLNQNLTHFTSDKEITYTEETKQTMPKILHSDGEIGESPLKSEVKKLFSICVQFIQDNQRMTIRDDTSSEEDFQDQEILTDVDTSSVNDTRDYQNIVTEDDMSSVSDGYDIIHKHIHNKPGKNLLPQTLKHITYNEILKVMYKSCNSDKYSKEFSKQTLCEVKALSKICLDIIKANLYGINAMKSIDMTINSVNTLSEEAFLNIEDTCTMESNQYQYFDEDTNQYEDEFEPEYEFDENTDDTAHQDNNWVKQVQMKEFKSCLVSNMITATEEPITDQVPEPPVVTPSGDPDVPFMVNIKSEPLEEELVPQDNLIDASSVKTEPSQVYNEFTISLEHVTTKAEPENSSASKKKDSYDRDTFEAFVNSNKMMRAADDNSGSEEIFSQSALRVRRQFDPDSDDENDAGMSLLIPHTYEPLRITEAKDTLMQSSSDEGSKDPSSKKKIDKRKKRGRKTETKTNNKEVNVASKTKGNKTDTVSNEVNKEINNATKTKNNRIETINNEVAMLTRRMRERIRQEEKKVQSSDSETETIDARSKTDKKKGTTEEIPDTSQKHQKNYNDTDIQCNNVDSTEQVEFIGDKTGKQKESVPDEMFTGFSTVDQNEITTYQKYLKDVYDKILPKIVEQCAKQDESRDKGTIMNADEPVEYLECEPTLPIFDKEPRKRTTRRTAKTKAASEQVDKQVPETVVPDKVERETVAPKMVIPESQSSEEKPDKGDAPGTQSTEVVDRHGWQCYPIDVNDRKLYDDCQILLDKLPETFVEMYFQYQNITERSKEDEEVDRLTNLQSLHGRTSNVKEVKSRTKVSKDKTGQAPTGIKLEKDSDGSRPGSPVSDHYNELTPSEDEGSDREEEVPPLVAKPATENNMAKNSLMDDNSDSDTENAEGKLKKIKAEPVDEASTEPIPETPKRRPGPKSKTRPLEQKPVVPPKPAEHPDIMLTADKMMNKELNMLHAPINLDEKVPEAPAKKASTKGKQKRDSSKKQIHYRIKNEDDSSSEEEKQWVTTKEKLLKRLEKRQETTIADEAKRTKIVSEYIERRGENPEPRLTGRKRGRRSNKRFLERQKQLRVLTRELLGDAADELGPHHAKRYNQAFFKGRRNIRKVIDKKSLARSTVMANMEEFERKRRLNMKQAKLREILGCEEGVNVLVINDELCLEYDFEQQQPVVSVHPFFTKIMKAHQYEGVKFMWDACFESLSQLATGSPGGGCILAHCMGLGKTLQVLALLHTVLTHPGVGMQRVLVCCPLSTVLNWVDEIHKWIGPVTDQIKVFELSKLKKTYERAYQLEDWYSGGGIFIIGYELFRSLTTLDAYLDDIRPTIVKKIRTALLDPGPDIIVCDEGHLLKNDCSVLAVAMSRVVTKRRIVLTGTPMQNNLREYYCMVNFVKPNLLGTYSEYSNRFENPIMNGQHRDSSAEDIKLMKARTHILHKVLEGCLQRQEASVLYPYLPKKHEYTVFISLTKCQWDMYKYYLTHYANKAKHGVLKDFHMLQKIWSHPQVLHHFQTKARDVNTNKVKTEKIEDDLAEEEATTEDIKPSDTDIWWLQFLEGGAMLDSLESSNKFVVVFRILDECIQLGDKVLIFSTSLFTMDALEFFLRKINKWSLGQEYYRLDGSVPAEVRQKWCREFNAEHNLKTKLFLISTRAGSLGLNMVAANRVIILDTSWNPAHDIQSIFRVYRFGQKKDCYIYRLVALGTMEQKIYERSVTKQAVACRVVDEQQIDRHYNMQELTELYRFDESGTGVESGVAPGVRDVALLRVARLRALHAVHEHDSLLRGSEPALPEHERQAAWSQFQQEHENGQLQSNEKIKKITAVKRAYNKAVPATALKPDPGVPDDGQDFKPPGPKPKRGRKSAQNERHFEGESILPDPDTERIYTLDPGTEQSMVKRITEILVRYNFSYKDAESALPQLVANVRRIVMSGQSMARCDKLTAEIAAVLMQRQDNMSMPLVNGIIGESVNQTMMDNQHMPPAYDLPIKVEHPPLLVPIRSVPAATPNRGRRKKNKADPRCRKGYVYEEIPSTSTAPDNLPLFDRLLLPNDSNINNYGSRMKRKAALVAEKLLDTAIEDGVIDLDDDADYGSSTDSAPEAKKTQPTEERSPPKPKSKVTKPEVTITEKPQPQPSTSEPKAPKEPKARKSKQDPPKPVGSELEVLEDVMDTSILLSDDDDTSLVQTAVELEPEGEISVHPSLLKNSNFVKIVAHTYLAGNPMLDEDAAMLAARYSTYKAIKELETTGKPITSGPIYDIAVQVLGKPILKKLHNTSHKVDTAEDDSQSSLLLDLLSGNTTDKSQSTTEKAQAAEKPSKAAEKQTKAAEKQSKGAEKAKTAEKTAKAPEPEPVEPEKSQRPKRFGRGRKIYVESDDDSDTPVVADDVPLAQARNSTPTPQPSQRTRRGRQKEVTPEVTPSAAAAPTQPVPTPTHMYSAPGPTPTQMYAGPAPTPTQMYAGPAPTPTQLYAGPAPTPTQMYSATGPTPTRMYAAPGPTPTQMYPGPAPAQMYPAPTPAQRYAAPAQSQGVVPVGLFKTTVSVALPGEAQSAQREADECILPDDDDIRIVSDAPAPPAPPAPPAQSLAPTPASHLVAQPAQPTVGPRRNSKPIVLKMVRSATNPQLVEMVPTSQLPPTAATQYRVVSSEAQQPQQMPGLVPAPAPQVTGSTICLDSDDEDAPLAPAPVAHPAPYPTAISMASNAYNPTLNYAPITPNPTTAAPPVKLKLTKVDPSKFVLTTKKPPPAPPPQVPAPPTSESTGKDPPVRYIVIPKSQVAQMYPPLVPVSTEQIVPKQLIQANPDGTYVFQSMNAPTFSMPSTSNVFTHTGQNQANLNVLTHTHSNRPIATPTATIESSRKVTQNEPKILNATLSAPTVSIDSGRIIRQSSEELVPASAKKTTPLKGADRPTPAKPASSSSDSDSSDDDPLSILKDVVHIQAEPEAAPKPAQPKSNNKTIVSSHKPDPKNSSSAAPAASSSNTVPAKTRMFVDSVDLTFNDDEPENVTKPPASKTKPAPSKPQPAASKPQPTASKPNPTASKQALASKTQITVAKASAAKTQSIVSKSQPAKTAQPATKISQTTSKTVQSSASKTPQSGSKWQPTSSKTFQPTTSNKNISSNQAAAKKRTAPVETAPPKKKKTDHLMTLKDFNLDDIDDIIELD